MFSTARQLIETINQTAPGITLNLTIRRNARERVFEVVTRPYMSVTDQTNQKLDESEQTLVVELDRAVLPAGVKINAVRPASVAARLGLQSDDVIVAVDRRRFSGHAGFQRIQQKRTSEDMQLWQIRRGEQVFFLAVRERVVVQ